MQCFGINGSDVVWTETVKLTTIQSIHSFDSHCQHRHIAAVEFKILADLSNCNLTENISSLFEVRFPLNLAYSSEYFSPDQLYNLTAETGLPEHHRPPQTTADQIFWALKLSQTTFYSLNI